MTTVRDLGDRGYRTLAFGMYPDLPRVVASGPPVTTSGGHSPFLGGAVSGDMRAAVAEHAERGVDVVKVMASGGFATPETDQLDSQFTVPDLVALVDRAHRAGLPAVAHAQFLVGMQNALAARVDGIEHFTGLSSAGGAQIDDDLLGEVACRGVVMDLTMGNDRSIHALMSAPPPALAALMARFGVASFDEFYATRIGLSPGFASMASPSSRAWILARGRRGGTATPGGPWARWSTPTLRPRRSRLRRHWLPTRVGWPARPAGCWRGTRPTSSSWAAISPPTSRL